MDTIGSKLRALRGDIPRKIVAASIGIERSTLSNYENDIRVPTDKNKARIARFYGVTVDSIFYPANDTETNKDSN